MNTVNEHDYVTPTMAARLEKVSRQTIYTRIQRGQIRAEPIFGSNRVRVDSLSEKAQARHAKRKQKALEAANR